jgi:hypothetical protein
MAQHARRMRGQRMVVNLLVQHAALPIQRARVNIEQENVPAKRLDELRGLRELVFNIVLADEGLGSNRVNEGFVYLRNQTPQIRMASIRRRLDIFK